MSDIHKFCVTQIGRFAGRKGWPDPKEYPDAVRDMINALEVRASRGDGALAKRIVDTCVETSQYCPTVPDLLRVAAELREREQGGARQGFPGCALCDYSGWVSASINGYDFSTACSCRVAPSPPKQKAPKRTGNLTPSADWAQRATGDR